MRDAQVPGSLWFRPPTVHNALDDTNMLIQTIPIPNDHRLSGNQASPEKCVGTVPSCHRKGIDPPLRTISTQLSSPPSQDDLCNLLMKFAGHTASRRHRTPTKLSKSIGKPTGQHAAKVRSSAGRHHRQARDDLPLKLTPKQPDAITQLTEQQFCSCMPVRYRSINSNVTLIHLPSSPESVEAPPCALQHQVLASPTGLGSATWSKLRPNSFVSVQFAGANLENSDFWNGLRWLHGRCLHF